MADVYIKKFYVKYNGRKYGPREVLRGLSDAEAKKLVSESHGAMELIIGSDKKEGTADSGEKTVSEEDIPSVIPPVNPEKTVRHRK